jgi:DNA repair protein SbcC/Rad50
MKPLWLSLEGLQSYRERQVVDFSQMAGCGIFGIFGPTGSGKSTILDAMTLALFGVVGRASHNTQGIMNSACDSVSVSLAFELHLQEGRRMYRIDRVFRRKNKAPDSCEPRISRLVQLDADGAAGRETVLADKPTEINAAVGKLLGLQYNDFVRAVVLPQNQFQEFLLMGRKDKSDMLERLFCLEEFGQELVRKVQKARRRAEDEMRLAEGALDVLADATDEAVEALREAAQAGLAARRQAEQENSERVSQRDAAREIYQATSQRDSLLRRQSELAAGAAAVEADRQRLAAARAAAPIWPVLEEQQAAAAQAATLRPLVDQRVAGLADLSASLSALDQDLAAQEEQGPRQRRQLEQQIQKMEQAADVAGKMVTLSSRHEQLTRQLAELSQQREILDEQAVRIRQALDQSRERLAQLRQNRLTTKVDPAWRQELAVWQAREQTRAETALARQAEQARAADWEARLNAVAERLTQGTNLFSSGEAAVLREAAQRLRDNEPCPVCGSTDHPAPACGVQERLPGEPDPAQDRLLAAQYGERLAACREQADKLQASLQEMAIAAAAQLERIPRLGGITDAPAELQALYLLEQTAAETEKNCLAAEAETEKFAADQQALNESQLRLSGEINGHGQLAAEIADQMAARQQELTDLLPGRTADACAGAVLAGELSGLREQLAAAEQAAAWLAARRQDLLDRKDAEERQLIEDRTRMLAYEERRDRLAGQLSRNLAEAGFASLEDLPSVRLTPAGSAALADRIQIYDDEARGLLLQLRECAERLQGRQLGETAWQALEEACREAAARLEQAVRQDNLNSHRLADMLDRQGRRREREAALADASARRDRISRIETLIRGNAFVEYVAEERLHAIVAEATGYLGTMTRYRYSLELDDDLAFVVRDQMAGGQARAATSLSGGETFMASLALALALSSQIQLRGQSRLEFFFLDEGFGSLDPVMLDVVMDALERISSPRRMIGLISHVPELRQRIATRLIVTPPTAGAHPAGSHISLEKD